MKGKKVMVIVLAIALAIVLVSYRHTRAYHQPIPAKKESLTKSSDVIQNIELLPGRVILYFVSE
jgi:hypothetical protein